jgi:putative ABC transport system permease protein
MIAERLAAQYPNASGNESAEVASLHEDIVGEIRPALMTLLAAAGVVVLIACANVANLLLVRASVRGREVAIRSALGARRGRLVAQMLSESLVLALAGGALGLLLAHLAIPAVQSLSAGSIPRVADVTIDRTVLLFAFGASVLTGVIFGLVPALQISRTGAGAVLKEGGRSSVGTGGTWLRNGLLVGQVALALVLLVGASLLLRSFARLTHVDPGFTTDGVLAFQVSLPSPAYPGDTNRLAFFDALVERLSAAPSVRSASAVQTLPLRGNYFLSVAIHGQPAPGPGEGASASYRAVTPGYFTTLGIPVLRGRSFSGRDSATAPKVAIVDEAFARRHYRDETAIGRRIDIGNGTKGAEIIGVVGSVSYAGLDAVPSPTMYMPLAQDVFSTMWILARTDGDPVQLAPAVRQTVRDIDPSLPAYSISPLADIVSDSVAQRRFSMLLLGLFALIALFLAAVGLYGVVAYSVGQRTQEIGVRMAIGAERGDVLRMVLGGGMKLALVGVALGIGVSLLATRTVASMLFEVTPFDPASYAATAALLLAIAALACYVPARRAMSVDPIAALRQE